MPRGVYTRATERPFHYPEEMVSRVRVRYAEELGTTENVVWRLMRLNDIPRRKSRGRDQKGPANPFWKGEAATYSAFHHRVGKLRGKPMECSVCGLSDETRRYDWANLTGNYADPQDYARMCRACHHAYDAGRRSS